MTHDRLWTMDYQLSTAFMLKTLDRYIIKKYLTTFFFVVLIFTLIAVVIDFSEKIDDLIQDEIPAGSIFTEYYLPFMPYINGLLWPLYALITTIFFTSRMAYNSEIISMMGGGMNFYRLAMPYMLSAALIAGLHFYGNHYLIPEGNKNRTLFENTYVWKNNFDNKTKNIHLFLDENSKMYARRFSRRDTVCYDFTLENFKDNKLISKLSSPRTEWQGKTRTWLVRDYRLREFDGTDEKLTFGKKLDTLLNFTPDDIERRDNLKEAMNTPELRVFIRRERERGAANFEKYEVELHRRSAEPFTIFILTLIGLAVASRKVRGGMGLHLALGAGLGGTYIFLSKFSTTFSTNAGLSPQLGVWIPNLIFMAVTLFLISRAQK